MCHVILGRQNNIQTILSSNCMNNIKKMKFWFVNQMNINSLLKPFYKLSKLIIIYQLSCTLSVSIFLLFFHFRKIFPSAILQVPFFSPSWSPFTFPFYSSFRSPCALLIFLSHILDSLSHLRLLLPWMFLLSRGIFLSVRLASPDMLFGHTNYCF